MWTQNNFQMIPQNRASGAKHGTGKAFVTEYSVEIYIREI